MSIEFKTPFEIIEELSHTIEKTRKRKKIRQKDKKLPKRVRVKNEK
jgi:hypothetical protein